MKFISKNKNLLILLSIIIIAIIIIYIVINRKRKDEKRDEILKIVEQNIDVQGNYEDLQTSNALSTTFHNQFNFTQSDIDKAAKMATDIWGALGYFQVDKPDVVFNTIQSAGSKGFMSLISDEFNKKYNKILYTHLNDHLSASDLNKINDIIKNLP